MTIISLNRAKSEKPCKDSWNLSQISTKGSAQTWKPFIKQDFKRHLFQHLINTQNMVEAKNEILAKNEALSKQLQKLLKAQDTRLELYREFDM